MYRVQCSDLKSVFNESFYQLHIFVNRTLDNEKASTYRKSLRFLDRENPADCRFRLNNANNISC